MVTVTIAEHAERYETGDPSSATVTVEDDDGSAAEPLTAEFEAVPESHDGESEFTFELRFSEEFPISYRTLRDHAFEVSGGRVTRAQRLDKPSNLRWEIAVEPDGDNAVTVVLPVTGDCDNQGAICAEDGRMLSNRRALTVSGPVAEEEEDDSGQGQQQEDPQPVNSPATGQPTISGTAQVGETLTAQTSGIADEDGLDSASFGYQWLADGAAIQGAAGSRYTLAETDEGKAVRVRVSFTDDRGHRESLTSAATASVAGLPPPPLTASFGNLPASHDGASVFTFELRFSEEFPISYRTLRDDAFTVTGGTVNKAERLEKGSNIGWRVTVQPDGNGDVSIVLPVTTDCDARSAICAEDGRMLSHRLELTVGGP